MDRKSQRGFAVVSVMVLVGAAALAGVIILDVLSVDIMLSGHERRVEAARELAEGGVMEIVGDASLGDLLPTLASPDLRATYSPSASSFLSSADRRRFEGRIDLVRLVPVPESSVLRSRAVVYEVSGVVDGDPRFDVRTEVYRTVAVREGIVFPRRHAR